VGSDGIVSAAHPARVRLGVAWSTRAGWAALTMPSDPTRANAVPDVVWGYFRDVMLAGVMLTPSFDINTTRVTIDGITKVVADLTPADLMRMAEVERIRITAVTLARLDAIDAIDGGNHATS